MCQCDCGAAEKEFSAYLLASGHAKTCGGHKSTDFHAVISAKNSQGSTHRGTGTPLYNAWVAMKKRCLNPKHKAFSDYGGRGISVCTEWLDFLTFKAWAETAGYAPGLTLDREDNDLGYSPENCRWVSQRDQNRNKRSNLWVDSFGERKLLIDWSRDPRCVVGYVTLHRRVSKGVPAEEAITRPAVSGKVFQVSTCQV